MATTSATRRARGGMPLLLAMALGLGACSSVGKYNPWGEGGTSDLAAPPAQAVPNATPDDRGVITYASYQVAVARDGDTLATVATRVGTTPTALASRNALPEDAILHEGQVLVLPNDVPRPAAGLDTGQVTSQPLGWTPDQASAAIDSAPTGTAAASKANPFQNGQKEPLIDPVRHRVEEGETAYSIARLYGVSVTALASWNGLGPDLALRPNQELLIPIVSDANKITTAGAGDTRPGQGTPVGAPPSAVLISFVTSASSSFSSLACASGASASPSSIITRKSSSCFSAWASGSTLPRIVFASSMNFCACSRLFQNASPAINESNSLCRFCNVATSKKPPQMREFLGRSFDGRFDNIEHGRADYTAARLESRVETPQHCSNSPVGHDVRSAVPNDSSRRRLQFRTRPPPLLS